MRVFFNISWLLTFVNIATLNGVETAVDNIDPVAVTLFTRYLTVASIASDLPHDNTNFIFEILFLETTRLVAYR